MEGSSFMQSLDQMAVGFSSDFPGVLGSPVGEISIASEKREGRVCIRFWKSVLFPGKPVFAIGEVFGQFRGFAIALESESDISCVFADYEHVGPKAGFDLELFFVTLRLFVKVSSGKSGDRRDADRSARRAEFSGGCAGENDNGGNH